MNVWHRFGVLIILGLLAVLGIGGFYFFSHRETATNEPAALSQGVHNLTRAAAAEMITSYVKANRMRTRNYGFFHEPSGHMIASNESGIFEEIKKLESAGLVSTISLEKAHIGRMINLIYDYTDEGKKYILNPEEHRTGAPTLLMAEVSSVEVTGLMDYTDRTGRTMKMAEYTAHYTATPFGEILQGDNWTQDLTGSFPFVLYDDGWRINPVLK